MDNSYINNYIEANSEADKRGQRYLTFRHLVGNGGCNGGFKFIKKAWGSEEIIQQEPYAIKIMRVEPGKQVSLHFHKEKEETFVLIKGKLIVETYTKDGLKKIILLDEPFKSVTLASMTPHTFYCGEGQEEDVIFIEASSYDSPDDSYRITQSGSR